MMLHRFGNDLDALLKATPILPEKDARIIIVEIFSGLVYLNKRGQKIIHYDLKPGNVLFDEVGVAKVTDFGLGKIVEDNVGSQVIEPTCQGAQTYWYLPTECFDLRKTPFISSKVCLVSWCNVLPDALWNPFGDDQTQERIFREVDARYCICIGFDKLVLDIQQSERPDVLIIAQDPYLSYAKQQPLHRIPLWRGYRLT